MNEILAALSTFAVNAAWQLVLMLAVAWLLERTVTAASLRMRHRVWTATLLLATLVPLGPALVTIVGDQSTIEAPAKTPRGSDASTVVDVRISSGGLGVPVAVMTGACILYVGLLLLAAIRLALRLSATARLLRNARVATLAPEWLPCWEQTKQWFGLKDVDLLVSDHVFWPLTAGFVRPAVILPRDFGDLYSVEEFRAVVAHECAHIQRCDFSKNLLYEAVGLLTAFHPGNWLIRSRIAQTRELICDHLAAECLADPHAYALSLLEVARKPAPQMTDAPAHALGIFDNNALEERMRNLEQRPAPISNGKRRTFAMIATGAIVACAFAIGTMSTRVYAEQAEVAHDMASQHPAANGSKDAAKPRDLSCTYYDKAGKPFPGTCAVDPSYDQKYVCVRNDSSPVRQTQIGCKSKLEKN